VKSFAVGDHDNDLTEWQSTPYLGQDVAWAASTARRGTAKGSYRDQDDVGMWQCGDVICT
jgi:hypothetical protein